MLSIIKKNNILSKEELKDLLKRYHQDRRINKPLLLISEERINYLDIFKREFSNLTVYNNNIKIEEFDYIFDFLGSSKYLDKETITSLNRLDRTVSIDINASLSNINGLGVDILKSRETIVYQTYQPGHFLNMAKDYIGKLILYRDKDILSNKNDGLVVNEEIMINEEANDVTILEDVEKEQINKLYSEEEIEKAYEQAI